MELNLPKSFLSFVFAPPADDNIENTFPKVVFPVHILMGSRELWTEGGSL